MSVLCRQNGMSYDECVVSPLNGSFVISYVPRKKKKLLLTSYMYKVYKSGLALSVTYIFTASVDFLGI